MVSSWLSLLKQKQFESILIWIDLNEQHNANEPTFWDFSFLFFFFQQMNRKRHQQSKTNEDKKKNIQNLIKRQVIIC